MKSSIKTTHHVQCHASFRHNHMQGSAAEAQAQRNSWDRVGCTKCTRNRPSLTPKLTPEPIFRTASNCR